MPDTKDSALAQLNAVDIADDDIFSVLDKSDTTMAATGTNKRMSRAQKAIAMARWKNVEVDFGATGRSGSRLTFPSGS